MSHEQNAWVLLAHGCGSVHQPLEEKKNFPPSSLLQDKQGNTNEEDQLRGDKTCEQPKQTAEKHQGEPSPLKGRGDAMSRKSISVPGGRRPTDYKHVPREASKTPP